MIKKFTRLIFILTLNGFYGCEGEKEAVKWDIWLLNSAEVAIHIVVAKGYSWPTSIYEGDERSNKIKEEYIYDSRVLSEYQTILITLEEFGEGYTFFADTQSHYNEGNLHWKEAYYHPARFGKEATLVIRLDPNSPSNIILTISSGAP